MIEPQVLHGGASSWLRIAANSDDRGFSTCALSVLSAAATPAPALPSESRAPTFAEAPAGEPTPASGVESSSAASLTLTPKWNWASRDRNLVAIQRKM